MNNDHSIHIFFKQKMQQEKNGDIRRRSASENVTFEFIRNKCHIGFTFLLLEMRTQ